MKKFLIALVGLLGAHSVLAAEPLFDIKLGVTETVVVKGNNYISFNPLSDLIFKNMIVNDGNCLIGYGNGAMAPEYAILWQNTKMGAVHKLAKGESGSVYTTCEIAQINKIEIMTDKGIQTVRYDLDTEPVITVSKESESKEIQPKKPDSNLLDQLYKVSNYTCYQTKDEIDGIVELCTVLPTNDITEFTQPNGSSMSKILLLERAKEVARRARYVEILETYPTAKPKFEIKRSRSYHISSAGDVIKPGYDPVRALGLAESDLEKAIRSYESRLEELVDLKIRIPSLENQILKDKKLIAKIKSSKEELSERTKQTLADAEARMSFNLFKLERDNMGLVSEKEKELESYKLKIKEAQDKVMEAREEVKQYLQKHVSETQ